MGCVFKDVTRAGTLIMEKGLLSKNLGRGLLRRGNSKGRSPALGNSPVLTVCPGRWSTANYVPGEPWAGELGPQHSGYQASLWVDISHKYREAKPEGLIWGVECFQLTHERCYPVYGETIRKSILELG